MTSRRSVTVLVAICSVCFLLGGCEATDPGATRSAAADGLPFTSLVRGAAPGGTDPSPSLEVVWTPDELETLLGVIATGDRTHLDDVDLSREVLLAVALGVRPTSGYSISVRTVEVASGTLDVVVRRQAPAPGDNVRTGAETPYEVVALSRDLTLDASRYRLKDDSGAIITQGALTGPTA